MAETMTVAAPAPIQRRGLVAFTLSIMRRFLSASVATLVQNGFMFVLGLVLVRSLPPLEYGAYSMLLTLISIASVLINALVAAQMGVSLPRTAHPASQRAGGRMYASISGLCVLVFLPVTAATMAYGHVSAWLVVAGVLYVGSTMYKNYTRFYFYSLRQPDNVLKQDFLFVGLGLAFLAAIAFGLGLKGRLTLVVCAMAVANLLSSLWFSQAPAPAMRWAKIRRHIKAYGRQRFRAFWSFTNTLLSTLSANAPNLAMISAGSLTKLAMIAAPGTVLVPMRLLFITFQSTLRAEFSALIHRKQYRATLIVYLASTVAGMLVGAALGGFVAIKWAWLYKHLFAHGYDNAQIREATLISVAVASVGAFRLPGGVLLNAFSVFRYSAIAMAVIAPTALAISFYLAYHGAVTQVLYGALFGETAMFLAELGAIAWTFSRCFKGIEMATDGRR